MDKLKFFCSLGFTEYESKALSSLVRLTKASPKEISRDSGVPQNKLYKLLKDLEKIGVLETIPSDTKKYKIINITSFLKERISKKEIELNDLKSSLKKLKEIRDSEEEFVFSIIRGQRAIMNRIAEQNIIVKKEIIGIQRNWKLWGEGLRAMRSSIKRGVNVRTIGVVDEETRKRAIEWKKIGCNIRIYNKKFGDYPLRFTIFDNKTARLTLGKPEIQNPEDYITIWTKSPALINMLKNQFEIMWNDSNTF